MGKQEKNPKMTYRFNPIEKKTLKQACNFLSTLLNNIESQEINDGMYMDKETKRIYNKIKIAEKALFTTY